MPENNEFLTLQLKQVLDRQNKDGELIGRILDDIGEIKITLARNTFTVEEHHKRSKALERMQLSLQKRSIDNDKSLAEVKDSLAHIVEDLEPMKVQVDSIRTISSIFSGVPTVLKFFSLIFACIIGGYGVYAIVHDAFGWFHK